jgi:peptidoglycan/LPS O-acetylase OafA/YrhL
MSKQLSYRPDIDGLRAIAVLLVIGFHAFPNQITGGYVGVDIFFVISGFLITGLLLQDLEKNEFSFSGFYARRIRRIFPALITVLVASFAAGWVLLLPHEFTSLGLNIFGGAAFSSNLVLLGETGYFDLSAAQKPLLHLWSLGVEEQFYIVWPILLLLAFSRRLSIVILAVALFTVSFAWNVKAVGTFAAFYLPLTRAWELMIGGMMAALASQSDKLRLDRATRSIRSTLSWTMPAPVAAVCSRRDLYTVIGAGLIAATVIGLNKSSSFPGWWALLPTLGAALIIAADGAWLNRVLLANPVAVQIGLISYPLYLWHWPLLSFATVADPSRPSAQVRLAAILGATILAWATYGWIERPIRTGQHRPLKIACTCIAMSVIGGIGLATFHSGGFPYRIPPAIRDITTIPFDRVAEWRLGTCLLENSPSSQFAPNCLQRGHQPLLFLWGDSYAAALYPGLKQLQRSVNFGLAQYTTAGCPPLLSFSVEGRPYCVENNDFVFSVLQGARPDIVLLYSSWSWGYGNMLPSLADLVRKLRLLNIPRIVIMGPPPAWTGGLPKAAYDYYTHDPLHRMIPARSSSGLDTWYAWQQHFREQVVPLGTEYISAWDALCNGKECLTRLGADLISFDEAHLTIPGSIYLAQAIAPCLFPDRDGHAPMASGSRDQSVVCHRPNGQSVKTESVPGSRSQ